MTTTLHAVGEGDIRRVLAFLEDAEALISHEVIGPTPHGDHHAVEFDPRAARGSHVHGVSCAAGFLSHLTIG